MTLDEGMSFPLNVLHCVTTNVPNASVNFAGLSECLRGYSGSRRYHCGATGINTAPFVSCAPPTPIAKRAQFWLRNSIRPMKKLKAIDKRISQEPIGVIKAVKYERGDHEPHHREHLLPEASQ